MGLFSKKIGIEDILKALEELTEEEKSKVKEALADKEITEAEKDEAEAIDKANEEATEQPTEPEQAEEPAEEAHAEEPEPEAQPEEPAPETEPAQAQEEPATEDTTTQDTAADENTAKIIENLTATVRELSDKVAALDELRARLEEYEQKTADRFGYRGEAKKPGKNINDMTADELEEAMRRGEV